MKTKYYSFLCVVLTLFFLSTQSVYAQKRGFSGYTFYRSVVGTNKLDMPPTVQEQKYEVVPPFTSDCQTIVINPGNGCRVESSSLINSGIPAVSEITSPGGLESNILGMQASMMFDPNTGKVNLLASATGPDAEEYKKADATLEFTYNFIASSSNRIVQFKGFYAETFGTVGNIGAFINVALFNPSTDVLIWVIDENLTGVETRTIEDEKIDLFDFVREGDTVTLSFRIILGVESIAVLGEIPAKSAVSL